MTTVNPSPELAKYIDYDAGTKIPAGTEWHLWLIAAAWADTTVKELLADTAPVRAAHYEAAVRVEKALDAWDQAQSPMDTVKKGNTKAEIMTDLRSVAARMAGAAPLLTSNPTDAAEWSSASADVYRVCRDISTLVSVKGL